MSWYIAITNPNCHRRAERGLAEHGFRSFWPKMRKWCSHARTKIPKEYPILGRYLFVEVPNGDFWTVRNVNGIEALLTGDDRAPAKVPEDIVYRFRDRYMRGEWDFVTSETGEFLDHKTGEMVVRKNPIPAGARVRIMEGEFADMLAVVRSRSRGKLQFLASGKFYTTNESNVRAA